MENEKHQYTACGLDNIWLTNGYEFTETPYGKTISYHDIDGLHRAIGHALAESNSPLSGKEFKFLRREMDLTQRVLANLLNVDEQTIGRWEREETDVNGPAQTSIRMIYIAYCTNEDMKSVIERLAALDRLPISSRIFSLSAEEHWEFDQAA